MLGNPAHIQCHVWQLIKEVKQSLVGEGKVHSSDYLDSSCQTGLKAARNDALWFTKGVLFRPQTSIHCIHLCSFDRSTAALLCLGLFLILLNFLCFLVWFLSLVFQPYRACGISLSFQGRKNLIIWPLKVSSFHHYRFQHLVSSTSQRSTFFKVSPCRKCGPTSFLPGILPVFAVGGQGGGAPERTERVTG